MFLLNFVVLFNLYILTTGNLVCRDNNGEMVDWFYLYKLPEHEKSSGLTFAYITSNTKTDDWLLSNLTIDDPLSIPGMTLSPIYSQKNWMDLVVLMYNDEPPEAKTDGSHGHTKGVLATNTNSGFWLIHSVPHYPPAQSNQSYNYPDTARKYGQSFLCITMNADQMNYVGKQLTFNEPHIYSYNFPDHLKATFPYLYKAAKGEFNKDAPFWNVLTLQTISATVFTSFAKGKKFNKELYEDWVAPTLSTDLYAETWLHGTGKIDSDCSKTHHVLNIRGINMTKIDFAFSTESDHSKWAVSLLGNNNWICVGDINRALHQKERGGGTVCMENAKISTAYRDLINDVEPCPKFNVLK